MQIYEISLLINNLINRLRITTLKLKQIKGVLMIKKYLFVLLWFTNILYSIPQYYCTASDSQYYDCLLNLIGSLHKTNFDNIKEIAVYDLGLDSGQRSRLQRMEKVKLYAVEKVHPDILKPIKTTLNGKKVPGSYAWKPIIIKQALDMFPYILYLDAGLTVLKPLDDIFEYIQKNGYFLLNPGPEHTIADRSTKRVRKEVIKKQYRQYASMLLNPDTPLVTAGLQGLSHKVYNEYVLPAYEFAKEVSLFVDDDTCPKGPGESRHDQPLFAILAHINGYQLFTERGYFVLNFGDTKKLLHIHHLENQINQDTVIYVSRKKGLSYKGCGHKNFIRYNK